MSQQPEAERAVLLRGYELRLLRCTLTSSPPSDSPPPPPQPQPSDHYQTHSSLLNDLLSSIESGDYLRALSSDAAALVLQQLSDDESSSADRVYSELLRRVESFLVLEPEDDEDKAYRALLVVSIAVAAFLAFTQCNMTGPLKEMAKCPLALKKVGGKGEDEELVEWENWACNQLMAAGSDLLGKFSNLQYLVFAKMLLTRTRDLLFGESVSSTYGISSISWWLARFIFLQQRILDERSSSLFDLLHVYVGETLHHFDTLENVMSYFGSSLHNEDALAIISMVHLEAGIMEYNYGRVDSCRQHFESAEVAAGLQLSVTGILGFRTVHQVQPKAQSVLVTNTSSSNYVSNCPLESSGIQAHKSSVGEDNLHLNQPETSDILMTPKLLVDNDEGSRLQGIQNGGPATAPLRGIQQAVILARCLLIEKSIPHGEMQGWDMAPYIEAIDSQQLSYFIIKCFCDILRIRWESTRSRTKERALLMMDKLVQSVSEPSPGVAQRIPFCFGVYIPTIPALRKEYGELLVRCHLIGEAVKIFEDLELWDNLIFCYCLLEKKAAAVELIKKRLSEMPNDPRLWCSLGDVTNDDACYQKALEISNDKSARAKRSLARSAYNRGDYQTSKILWESAMALNSLHPDGWFALGAAALKARDVQKALDGFTRAVQVDPDNGEAWNNIACLHMINKRSKESFIAFKEALKFKRDSWQLWENYCHVALDVGNIDQALEAIQKVSDMTSNKRIDIELLKGIMIEVERRASTDHSVSPVMINDDNFTDQDCPADSQIDRLNESTNAESVERRSRETEHLEILGKVLQRMVRNDGRAYIWGLYARWHKIKGDLTMCSEALLKQVRSYQGSDLWKDRDRFKSFAQASLDLCKVYMEISSSTGSCRELLAAEMHLKNIIKQAESFLDTEEFRGLQACLDEVTMKLQSSPLPN
nr:tetratricopeptide repeat protein 27 homolog [Quercus suber]POE95544.1 tetratricopeptide repeat protein 27 like [Quercus suber]